MRAFFEIVRSGADGIVARPFRAVIAVLSVLAPLVPFLVGLAVAQGVEHSAAVSLASGGDFSVTGSSFGSPAPLPASLVDRVRRLTGVTSVVPRVVGSVALGIQEEGALVVGLPAGHYGLPSNWVRGRWPKLTGPDELVLGSELASSLQLHVGSVLPPFTRSRSGDRLGVVVGVLTPEAPFWGSRVIFTTSETAARIFDHPNEVTDLQIWVRPGAEGRVAQSLGELADGLPGGLRITKRETSRSLLARATLHREGLFQLFFVLGFVTATGAVLVIAGSGFGERSREIGLLKATGWRTDEVLLRSLSESLQIALLAFAASVGIAWGWLRALGGAGIAALFVPGISAGSPVRLPYHLDGTALAAAALIVVGVVCAGSLYPAWRAAVTSPISALRRHE